MRHYGKVIVASLLAIVLIVVIVRYVGSLHIPMLDPKGIVALKERNLMAFTIMLGFLIMIPVFGLTIAIAWRYREGNTKARYTPNVSTNTLAESVWWGIPIVIILVLSVITWISTKDIDPFKPLDPHTKSMTIKVVALNWKWLFIYPEAGSIATVNYVQFPVNTPVTFELTSDATMNSFWIPQLGGQLYAMPGMITKLNLNATEIGDYKGSSANISGSGFAGMKFIAKATSKSDFDSWVAKTKQIHNQLDHANYTELTKDSTNNPVTYYGSSSSDLYDTIVMKYMMPSSTETASPSTPPMDHSHMEGMDMSTMNMGTN
jgi:cytochrome o ubiquinol oxidase subunit 2